MFGSQIVGLSTILRTTLCLCIIASISSFSLIISVKTAHKNRKVSSIPFSKPNRFIFFSRLHHVLFGTIQIQAAMFHSENPSFDRNVTINVTGCGHETDRTRRHIFQCAKKNTLRVVWCFATTLKLATFVWSTWAECKWVVSVSYVKIAGWRAILHAVDQNV